MTARIVTILAVSGLLAAAASAQDETAVDLELVLAADGSGSIDDDELAVQRRGYAEAVTSDAVLDAIGAGFLQRIAVSYIEWGAPSSQHTIVDWMVIEDRQSARRFAEALVAAPRAAFGYNSISGAIDYAVHKMETNAIEGTRRVIDVSGDGPNIGGRPVRAARADAVALGMTVNALIVNRPGGLSPAANGPQLMAHYRNDVIGGPGAFVMVVEEPDAFADTVRRKMVLEIAGPGPGGAGTAIARHAGD